MPEMDGIALLAAAREISPDVVAIVMTGHAAIDTAVKAMQAGALDYIVKPFKLAVVLPVINRALSMRRLRLANRQLRDARPRTYARVGASQPGVGGREPRARIVLVFRLARLASPAAAPCRGSARCTWRTSNPVFLRRGKVLLGHVAPEHNAWGQLIEDLLALSQLGRQPLLRATFPARAAGAPAKRGGAWAGSRSAGLNCASVRWACARAIHPCSSRCW